MQVYPLKNNELNFNSYLDMQVFMEGVGLLYKPTKNVYAIEREAICIPKFLNRLLGLPAYAQNSLFQYFSDIVAELIKQAKFDGTYDMGIMGSLFILILNYIRQIFFV